MKSKIKFNIKKAHGIMFHHFHDDLKHIKGQGSIDHIQFENLLIFLKKNFKILKAENWYKKAINNELTENEICLTFDDNLLCQYEVALPILEKYGLTAFWFIYSSPLKGVNEKIEIYRNFRMAEFQNINQFYDEFDKIIIDYGESKNVESGLENFNDNYLSDYLIYSYRDKKFRFIRDKILGPEKYYSIMDKMISKSNYDVNEQSKKIWMRKDQISYLNSKKHFIGLHSHSHPTKINNLNIEDQKREYSINYKILKEIINDDLLCVSHPSNSYNNSTLKILKDLNIKIGFRANMKEGFNSIFELPRIDHSILIQKLNI